MAQVAQSGTGRNTGKISPGLRQKSRNWAFTLNNPMEAELKNLQNDAYSYIFQEETGKEGTPHLQGTIILKDPQALSYVKKINGRAHWEVCKNKFASINYCQKGESRTGKMYTNMDVADEFGTLARHKDEKINIEKYFEENKEKLYEEFCKGMEEEFYKNGFTLPQGQWRSDNLELE